MRDKLWLFFLSLGAIQCGDGGGGGNQGRLDGGESDSGKDSGTSGHVCPNQKDSCGEGELCLLDAQSGSYRCIAEESCRSDKRCETECCPTGTECVEGRCPLPDIFADSKAINSYVESEVFEEGDCELDPEEGPCVGAPGERVLLRFTTQTPNIGEGNMVLGFPADETELFHSSACHGHYHFNEYARYDLLDADGNVVADGGKRAFCLVDLVQLTSDEPPRFACSTDGSLEQGIQTGWADEYFDGLPCQWIDVTDVVPGKYTLRIRLNYEFVIAESDYSNNTTEVPVEIP